MADREGEPDGKISSSPELEAFPQQIREAITALDSRYKTPKGLVAIPAIRREFVKRFGDLDDFNDRMLEMERDRIVKLIPTKNRPKDLFGTIDTRGRGILYYLRWGKLEPPPDLGSFPQPGPRGPLRFHLIKFSKPPDRGLLIGIILALILTVGMLGLSIAMIRLGDLWRVVLGLIAALLCIFLLGMLTNAFVSLLAYSEPDTENE